MLTACLRGRLWVATVALVACLVLALPVTVATAQCTGATWLCYPDAPELQLRAPDSFEVEFSTSKGVFRIQATRAWAPHGTDRFYNLVRAGYYNQNRFYRVLPDWVCQWGVNGNPDISAAWSDQFLPDDVVRASNTKGAVAFSAAYSADRKWATNRTTELYINYHNNSRLDALGFAPFGVVSQGLGVVQAFYAGYGEMCATSVDCPAGHLIETELYARGNAYLNADFPRMDFAVSAVVVDDPNPPLPDPPGTRHRQRQFWHRRMGFGDTVLLAVGIMCLAAVCAACMVSCRRRCRRHVNGAGSFRGRASQSHVKLSDSFVPGGGDGAAGIGMVPVNVGTAAGAGGGSGGAYAEAAGSGGGYVPATVP